MVRGSGDKEANDIQARSPVARNIDQKQRNEKWAVEKPKLDNAGRSRGICFIVPAHSEFKETIKNARRKLEVPMEAAMLCKTRGAKYRRTCRTCGICKTRNST